MLLNSYGRVLGNCKDVGAALDKGDHADEYPEGLYPTGAHNALLDAARLDDTPDNIELATLAVEVNLAAATRTIAKYAPGSSAWAAFQQGYVLQWATWNAAQALNALGAAGDLDGPICAALSDMRRSSSGCPTCRVRVRARTKTWFARDVSLERASRSPSSPATVSCARKKGSREMLESAPQHSPASERFSE
jgi:hypothetical protein